MSPAIASTSDVRLIADASTDFDSLSSSAESFANHPDPLTCGDDHVDGLQIVRQVGRGGFATVFAAVELSTRQPVAVKILRTDR